MNYNCRWTTVYLERLIELKKKGLTYEEISKKFTNEGFEVTKNSCISALHRRLYGAKKNKKASSVEPKKRFNKSVKEEKETVAKKKHEKPTSIIKFPDNRFMATGYCRQIVGDPKHLTCCGEKTERGNMYCDYHADINFSKKPDTGRQNFIANSNAKELNRMANKIW